jgi:integrase
MALLVECPECKKRNSSKAKTCKCGFGLAKFSGRVWWIEYYDHEKRLRRERIGPNKAAAEHRLRAVLSARAEERQIRKNPEAKTTFKPLAQWYLELPGVKAKRSYDRDKRSLKLLMPFFGDRLLKDITPGVVEAYRQKRLASPSGRSPKNLTKPATVNREIACLKTIFNKAIKDGKAERNPCQGVKMLRENNERDRVLSSEEYTRLLAHCPAHLKTVVKLAYYTAMRQGEILNLTWGQVDLKEGFIKLRPDDCKPRRAGRCPLIANWWICLKPCGQGCPFPK